MTRSALKLAMDRVDAGDDDAARQVGADTDQWLTDRPINPEIQAMADKLARDDAERAEQEAKRKASLEVARRKLMDAETFADCLTFISRCKARAGHDLTAWAPAEANHVRNIHAMGAEVLWSDATELPADFKKESDPQAVARGAAVADVLGGGQ